MNCTTCGISINWVRCTTSACKDGWSWQGSNCATYKSIRTRLLLLKSKLTLYKWYNRFTIGASVCQSPQLARRVTLLVKTAIDRYQWLREVCSTKLLATPIKLGGHSTIVQTDESLFNHKPRYSDTYTIYHVCTNLCNTYYIEWQRKMCRWSYMGAWLR